MNVTALVRGSTGAVAERYVYDSYGNFRVYDADWTATATNKTAVGNELYYCGYRFEPELAVYNPLDNFNLVSADYHVRARELSTKVQWLQRDPAEDEGSLYIYGSSD